MSIGIDVGGTKIEAALINNGEIVNRLHLKTDKSSPERFLDQISHIIETFGKSYPVGIGIAGQVDTKNNRLILGPNLGFKNVNFNDRLKHPKLFLLNDVRAAGIGEWKEGCAKGLSDFIAVFLGTGIGGMIVSNNKVIEGHQGIAGEIGHLSIDYKGLPCSCGSIGCLETVAAGWGLAKRAKVEEAKTLFEKGPSPLLDEAMLGLAFGIKGLVNTFNPQAIIVGGGLLNGYEKVYPDFLSQLEKKAKELALDAMNFKIIKSSLGEFAGVRGAARYAIDSTISAE